METVRGLINRLLDKGLLAELSDGLTASSNNSIGAWSAAEKMRFFIKLVEQLIDDLDARGIPLCSP